jgi:hypothetical protein
MRTRDKLAAELRKVAEQASPANAAKYEAFAKRAATGEFDATKEESDEWVYSEDGQAAFRQLPAEMRKVINGGVDPLIPDVKH